MVMTPMTSPC
jgi:transposase InsO family protein